MMLDHALSALDALFEPTRLLALFGGMIVGMIFGMLPGLGGVAAVSILLPFIYYLDAYSGVGHVVGGGLGRLYLRYDYLCLTRCARLACFSTYGD